MSKRYRAAVPDDYLDIEAVLRHLLADSPLRDIAHAARHALRVAFAAVSFPIPKFSTATTIFVRESLIAPADFAPCAATVVADDVFIVPHLADDYPSTSSVGALQSYAGCAARDRRGNCIAVLYLMDVRRYHPTTAETAVLRAYARLVSSRVEIVRRFGGGRDPSPRQIIWRADEMASEGRDREAQELIALAYAAHDIAHIRQRTSDPMHP